MKHPNSTLGKTRWCDSKQIKAFSSLLFPASVHSVVQDVPLCSEGTREQQTIGLSIKPKGTDN